jgi:hypothetical protein
VLRAATADRRVRQPKDQLRLLLKVLDEIETKIATKRAVGATATYGLPDLLFERGETQGEIMEDGKSGLRFYQREKLRGSVEENEEAYQRRQNETLRNFLEENLYIVKDTRQIPIKTFPPMMKFISDLFFRRTRRAILWKGRGCGGSLAGAIVIWLCMVYHRMSFIDMAGAGEQAKIVYEYVVGFFNCIPGLKQGIMDGAPLISQTKLRTGVRLKCITTSEKQARGKHMAGFLGDEAAMDDEKSERAMRAAMQGPLSEEDSIVILLSTFHVPVGLFQMYWDDAEEMGFSRYRWNVFDAMQRCDAPIDCKKCYLTERREIEVREGTGKKAVKQDVWVGCNGQGRKTQGYLTRHMVIEDKKMNRGTTVFEVEFCNQRPQWMRPIYEPGLVDDALTEEIAYATSAPLCVGIDWGLESEDSMCMILGVRMKDHVGVLEAVATSGMLVDQIIKILFGWYKEYGEFEVWADQSHPFENRVLEEGGFPVQRVSYREYRDFGVKNVQRYLAFRRLKILRELEIVGDRLKGYRKDKYGRAVKDINSHVADAMMCMLIRFPFMEEFPDDIRSGEEEIQGFVAERSQEFASRKCVAHLGGVVEGYRGPKTPKKISGKAPKLSFPSPLAGGMGGWRGVGHGGGVLGNGGGELGGAHRGAKKKFQKKRTGG